MTQPILCVPASRCTLSPSNVRAATDPQADVQLEASIAEHGILQNLIGVAVARKKGHYRITASGRRLAAVQRLIEAGTLPADTPLPVKAMTSADDAVELSLAENFLRLAMNPADECRAFQDLITVEGRTPADIARRFGLTERFVLGRLRLAGLAASLFEALRDGEISLDVAMAYAATPDTERQARLFDQLKGYYDRTNVAMIRRSLHSGGARGSDPRALPVGRTA